MKQLTRAELKQLKGAVAQSCSMVYLNSNGQWQTESGSCDQQCVGSPLTPTSIYCTPFCHTQSYSGPVPLTSNGGVSQCGAPYYPALPW